MVPEELKYTEEHEWALVYADGTVRIGLTDYAQRQLGEVALVELPNVGDTFAEGETLGHVESTKAVSEIYAPLGGSITAVNDELGESPETVNDDCYGAGWIAEIKPTDTGAVDKLLDAKKYENLIDQD